MEATQEQLVMLLDRLIEQTQDDLTALADTIAVNARALVSTCETIRIKMIVGLPEGWLSVSLNSLGELQASPNILDRMCMQFSVKQAHLRELEQQRAAWK